MQGSLLEHFNVKEDQYCYFNQSVVLILRPISGVILSYPVTLNQQIMTILLRISFWHFIYVLDHFL